jgi:ferric-dicitrate binding protein FerR (iron transport regulator)
MARSVVVGSDGRAKAFRPIPESERAAAISAGLASYAEGDFFIAHEQLEPAWMGTDDHIERAWLQSLIKLAAAYVHGVRGNPAGITRNLQGARSRLAEAVARHPTVTLPDGSRLDLAALLAAIDERLVDLAANPGGPTLDPPELPRRAR